MSGEDSGFQKKDFRETLGRFRGNTEKPHENPGRAPGGLWELPGGPEEGAVARAPWQVRWMSLAVNMKSFREDQYHPTESLRNDTFSQ